MNIVSELDAVKPAGLRKGSIFYPELESLRGVAIILVTLFHTYGAFFGAIKLAFSPEVMLALVQGGHTGVTLFFVLSSFLLGMPFIKASVQRIRRPNVKNFFKRRFLRIVPLYVVAVLVATVAVKDIETGARALFFWVKGGEMYPYSAVWWSLRVEAQFYLLLPVIGTALWYSKSRLILAALVAIYLSAYFVVYVFVEPQSRIHGHSLFGRGIVFLIGLGAAYVYLRYGTRIKTYTSNSPQWKNGGSDILFIGVVILLMILLYKITEIGYFEAEINYQYLHIVESIIWATIVLILLLFPLRLKRMIHNKIFALLGVWSYSLYLNHYPIVFFGIVYLPSLFPSAVHAKSPERVAFTIALVIVAIIFAGITYNIIEKPFLKKKERLT